MGSVRWYNQTAWECCLIASGRALLNHRLQNETKTIILYYAGNAFVLRNSSDLVTARAGLSFYNANNTFKSITLNRHIYQCIVCNLTGLCFCNRIECSNSMGWVFYILFSIASASCCLFYCEMEKHTISVISNRKCCILIILIYKIVWVIVLWWYIICSKYKIKFL